MKTIRETAATGILAEHCIRQLVKDRKIAYIKVGNRVLVNYTSLVEQLSKPDLYEGGAVNV